MAKKLFVLALGALLVVAFCAPVMAETKVDFSGSYRVRAHYYNNLNLAGDEGQEEKSSYFDQRFRAMFNIMPSENLTLVVATQALDNKWGTSVYSKRYHGEAGASSGLEIYYAYMDIKTSFGVFSIGRQSTGVAGLSALGYTASSIGSMEVFDSETPEMRIKYVYTGGPLKIVAAYDKITEQDQGIATQADSDYDRYIVMPEYKFANGGVNMEIAYLRDATGGGAVSTAWTFNPALALNFGPVGLHAELKYLTGEVDDTNLDLEGLGVYLDGVYNYGPGMVGLQYAYFQGDDNAADNTVKGLVTAGGDFNPIYLVTNKGILGSADSSNYWMLSAFVDHNITEDLLLHAAVGYFGINEPGKKALDPTSDADSHFGTEIDFGMSYNIMANLSWELQLAYFIAGDYVKDASGANDVGNAYGMRNVLTLKF